MAGELKPPRVRPAIKRIAIWVTPVLLLIGAWQIWDAVEARRLERALAPVLGPPVPMKIVAGATDEGAGKYYAAAAIFAISVKRGDSFQAVPGGPIVDAAIAMRDALARAASPPKQALDEASRQIEQGRPVFDLLSTATALPFDRFAPGTDFNFRFSGLLEINRLAGLETMRLAMSGQGDSAARVLVDRLRSLRAFQEQSLDQMTRARQVRDIATDLGILVARANVTSERLDEIDRSLADTYAGDALERGIRGEALWAYALVGEMWTGRSVPLVGPLLRPALRHHVVMRLNLAAEALSAARLPWPDRIRAINAIPEPRTIVPEVVRFVGAWRAASLLRDQTLRIAEAIAAVRCARLIIAVEHYRRDRGAFPETLADFANPRDEQALDPFTGKPLLYSHKDGEYVIYSVGRNGKDEGGKLVADLPPGRAPGTLPPADIGVGVMLNRAARTP